MRPNRVAVKIRPRKRKINGRVYRDFVVDLGFVQDAAGSKKRKTRTFKTSGEAEAFLSEKKDLRRRHGDAAMLLPQETALRYASIEERLAAAGVTIEQAADFWLENHKPVKERLTIGELLDRCVLDMELRKVAGNSIATFSCACRSFVTPRQTREAGAITREEIREWIFGNGWEPKTQRGYLGAIVELFNYGVRDAQCLAKSPLAKVDGKLPIKLPKLTKKEPAIFTVEQIERLFATALTKMETGLDRDDDHRKPMPVYRRLLGFLALATFAGIRPFELVRLEVSAIDLKAGHVPLDAKVTKTNDRRIVDLSPNCVRWLRLWRAEFPNYTHVAPPSWDRLMKKLRAAAKLRPWPHDVLRHCFASYFHARHGDKTKLQNQMGHSQSEDTLDKHYRAVRGADGRPVTKAQALKFWKIAPPRKG